MAGPGIPFVAVARALYSLLNGQSPALASGGIHQRVPPGTAMPYVAVGHPTHMPDDSHTGWGHEVTVRVDTYSDADGEEECAGIMSEINALLHGQTLTVTGYNFVSCFLEGTPEILEQRVQGDVTVQHGVQRYRVKVRTP